MDFVLGNLPKNVEKNDIKKLIGHYRPSKIKFYKNEYVKHSTYECVVSLNISDPVAGSTLESHLNNFCLNGSRICVHRLIF